MPVKYCVLDENKVCDDCGECSVCDLDPNKICDNCMQCLRTGADYRAIEIDEIIEDGTESAEFEQLRRELAEMDAGEKPFDCFREEKGSHD